MTITIFVLKGELNGKIVVECFFFAGYTLIQLSNFTNDDNPCMSLSQENANNKGTDHPA